MTDLQELYQQVILDHNKNPRNFGKPAEFNHFAEGFNPLCGDHINVYLTVENGMVKDAHFDGSGCAISKSSASIMTGLVKGKSEAEADVLFEQFRQLITDQEQEPNIEELGKLAVFAGVREFPARVKCASLAWHTFKTAIGDGGTVSTE